MALRRFRRGCDQAFAQERHVFAALPFDPAVQRLPLGLQILEKVLLECRCCQLEAVERIARITTDFVQVALQSIDVESDRRWREAQEMTAEFVLPCTNPGDRLAQIDERLTGNDFVPQQLGDVVSRLFAISADDQIAKDKQTLLRERHFAPVVIDETQAPEGLQSECHPVIPVGCRRLSVQILGMAGPCTGALRLGRLGDGGDERDDLLAQHRIGDLQEGAIESDAFLRRNERGDFARLARRVAVAGSDVVAFLEEEAWMHAEDIGDRLETAGADAVGAFFVLLNLLECDPETVGQLFLAQPGHQPTHPDAGTDKDINLAGGFCVHLYFLRT
ncbi:hypothetical protein D9M70_494270 [compost metagenome]